MYLFVAISMVVVEIPAIVMRIIPFRTVITQKHTNVLTCLYAIVLTVNFLAAYAAAQANLIDVEYYKLKLVLSGALLTAANLIVIRKHIPEQLFTCGVEAILSTILPVMVSFLGRGLSLGAVNMQFAVAINAYVYTLIYSVGFPFFSKLIVDCVEPFLSIKVDRYWQTIFLIPLTLFIGNFLTYPETENVTNWSQFAGQILMIVATIMMCMSISKDSYRMRTREMMAMNMEIQKQYFNALTEKVEMARRQLHDAKYLVASIEKYIESDDKDGLAEYCKTLIPKRYYSVSMFHSGNSAVDGVLYHYSKKAEENDIRFKIAGTVRNPGIEDDELCILLGNAMENAFTACMTREDGRFVTFVAQTEDNVLSLMVQNSFDGVIDVKYGILQSRKRKSGPGIGISSMKQICEKYNGTMETQYDEETFTVLIILPLTGE